MTDQRAHFNNDGMDPDWKPSTTASTTLAKSFTLDDLKAMERTLAQMPKPVWSLIAPDGRAWMETDPQVLLRVLAGASFASWQAIEPDSATPQPSPPLMQGENKT
jgi:hypothetical protein